MASGLLPDSLASDPRLVAFDCLVEEVQRLDTRPVLIYLVDTVASSALPALATQFHVMGDEGWNLAASDEERRALIKSAIELHRYKGTPWAIKQALTKVGFDAFRLIERPDGAHWAEFDVELSVDGRSLSESFYPQVTQLIDMYKPARSHLRRLTVSVSAAGTIRHAAAVMCGESISIFPYSRRALELRCPAPVLAIGVQSWITTEVRPR